MDIVVLEVRDLREKARLVRLARSLRQVVVAGAARCSQSDVSAFERGLYVPRTIKRRILPALGLVEDAEALEGPK